MERSYVLQTKIFCPEKMLILTLTDLDNVGHNDVIKVQFHTWHATTENTAEKASAEIGI